MKELRFTPATLDEGAIECHNLRRDLTGALVPVGVPARVANDGGKPLLSVSHADGSRSLLTYRGTSLCSVAGGKVAEIAQLAHEPLCMAQCGRQVVAMADSGPLAMDLGTDSPTLAAPSSYEPLALTRMDKEVLSVQFAPRTLRDTYRGRITALGDNDAADLTAELRNAYTDISDRAAHARHYIQPVLARYRLLGAGGAVLYESAPRLVAPAAGVQCQGFSTRLSRDGDTMSMQGGVMSATAFTVGVTLPSEPSEAWRRDVRGVQLLVSPQLHAVDLDAPAQFTITGMDSTDGDMALYTPGIPASTRPIAWPGSEYRNRLTGALARMDRLLRVEATVAEPGTTVEAYNGIWRTTRQQIAGLQRTLELAVSPSESELLSMLAPPHAFTASTVGRSGDLVVWGGIEVRQFQGYTLREMGISVQPGAGTQPTACRVEMADGGSVVAQLTEHGDTTTALSPLLVYPGNRAVGMTVCAGTRRQRVDLEASADGRWSFYLAPDCRPVMPEEEVGAFVVPAANETPVSYPDAVAVARASDPLKPLCAARCSRGRVVAVTAASRSSSAWDFARVHFYAFTTAGIYTLAVNARRTSASVADIDGRAVLSRDAVAVTSQGVAAIAGGDLVVVKGSAATSLELDVEGAGFKKLGWVEPRGELWVCLGNGTVGVCGRLSGRGSRLTYTRDDVSVSALLSDSTGLYLLDNEGVLRDAYREGNPSISSPCRYKLRLPYSPARTPSTRLVYALFASYARVRLELRGDNGAGHQYAALVVGHDVNGALNCPLASRIPAPRRLYLTVSMAGTLSSDGRLESVILGN